MGKARDQAADVVGSNGRYVSDAKKLQAEAPALAAQVRAGGKTIRDNRKHVVQNLGTTVPIVHVTPHMMRKTFVTTLLRSGVDVYTLQRLSGHKSLEALRPYVAIANTDAQAAHKRNSPVQTLLT